MIPEFPNSHPVFDEWPVKQNYPCPVSKSRLRYYQRQIDRIAGKASSNGRSNVRVIWAADPDTRISGQIPIDGEWKARYAIRTETYECTRKDMNLTLLSSWMWISLRRASSLSSFTNQQRPRLTPRRRIRMAKAITHLFTVGFHDETCCAGREAANGSICWAHIKEPSDTHLDLANADQASQRAKQVRMIGDPITAAELAEDYRRVKSWVSNETC